MKRIRKENEDLEDLLKELKIGDSPIFDNATAYEIIKVPNGFIYTKEYVGMVFVPDFPMVCKIEQEAPKVAVIPNSVTKASPKRAVAK
jgi:hypothetical protein